MGRDIWAALLSGRFFFRAIHSNKHPFSATRLLYMHCEGVSVDISQHNYITRLRREGAGVTTLADARQRRARREPLHRLTSTTNMALAVPW